MQFRTPFRPSPSDQSWQPQEFPIQHQVSFQQQQQLYPPQFQPPPVMQSKPPEKKSRKRFWLVIATLVVVLALATALGSLIANSSSTARPQIKAAPIQAPQAPTQAKQPISQTTPASTSTTTAENLQNIKPTHGSPSLGGQISDFIGTYGRPSITGGKDLVWLLNSDGSLALDTRDTGRGVVGYVSISTPDSWSRQKVQDYCLAFAPHDYTLDKTSNPDNSSGLYVYDSPSGKFSLHVSSGYPMYCYMSSISNP